MFLFYECVLHLVCFIDILLVFIKDKMFELFSGEIGGSLY